jgi:putative membrane protein
MYTRRAIKWSIILRFGWRYIVFFILYGTAVALAYHILEWKFLQIPFLPISAIGVAVAFYLGFKNNSSYDRLWEARRVWGSLVNASRSWGIAVMHFIERKGQTVPDDEIKAIHQELLYRHLAFLNALRVQLRKPAPWEQGYKTSQTLADEAVNSGRIDAAITPFLGDHEANEMVGCRNSATQILHRQSERLQELRNAGLISEFNRIELYRLLSEFYNQQGASERIKGFPFPRQYAYFSLVFTWMFVLMLPFGLVPEFAKFGEEYVWMIIPFYTLISFVFNTMEIVGATSENPFENGLNDVPITAICRNVEIDLREMLGEVNLPKKAEPVHDILM